MPGRDRYRKLVGRIHEYIDCASDIPEAERPIFRDYIEDAVYNAAEQIENPPTSKLKSPVPGLTARQIAAIKRQGRIHPWSKRGNYRGGPFGWIREFYGTWIPGLLCRHILLADRKLYAAFMQQVSRKGLPADLDVPSAAENRLRGIKDPSRRRALIIARKAHALRVRILKESEPKSGK